MNMNHEEFILAHLDDGSITKLDSRYLKGSEGFYKFWFRFKGAMVSRLQDPEDKDDYIELSRPEIVIGWEQPGDCENSYSSATFSPDDGDDWMDQAFDYWQSKIDYCDSQR